MNHEHFAGKTLPEHLIEARVKGALASAEIHGVELPGHIAAGGDAAKETALLLLLLWALFSSPTLTVTTLCLFALGLLLWKVGRSAFLGWMRLDRLHRVIEEERWEIEHHRDQEREELEELYRAKGFSGKLLKEVVDLLMADDNRLLQVMLEEELGLSLESYEHPLKQSAGAACGVIASSLLAICGFYLHPLYGLPIAAGLSLIFATLILSRLQKNPLLPAVIWTLSIAILSAATAFSLAQLLHH